MSHGREKQNDWQGFERPEDLPRPYNPECGYFVTSNQNLNEYGKVAPINVGMGPYRSDRIARLLSDNDKITSEYMYRLHYDVYSTQAELFMKILAPLLPDTGRARILKNWNLEYSTDSEGAFFFDRFCKELYMEVFGDGGFGREAADHIEKRTGILNDFYVNFDRILLSEDSLWFGGRTREEIYLKAAETALKSRPETWGNTRKVLMKNIFFDGRPEFRD
ncbi:MAG: penicillin acylase family protein [Deltaproteobacteria bacterium]|nr:penicillin acylase family protein [Deltaproteobacteria bacterium]